MELGAPISVRIDEKTKEKIKALAKRKGISMSAAAREILEKNADGGLKEAVREIEVDALAIMESVSNFLKRSCNRGWEDILLLALGKRVLKIVERNSDGSLVLDAEGRPKCKLTEWDGETIQELDSLWPKSERQGTETLVAESVPTFAAHGSGEPSS